jgi:hypothetical protein
MPYYRHTNVGCQIYLLDRRAISFEPLRRSGEGHRPNPSALTAYFRLNCARRFDKMKKLLKNIYVKRGYYDTLSIKGKCEENADEGQPQDE